MRSAGMTAASCLVGFALCAGAEDAQETYNSLFKKQEPSALQRQESSAFAAKLFRYADQIKENRALKLLLLEKSYEFALRDPTGYATAISAMKLIANVDPLLNEVAQKRILEVYRRQYLNTLPSQKRRAGADLLRELTRVGDSWFEMEVWYHAKRSYEEALAVASAIESDEQDELRAKLQHVQRIGGKALLLQEALRRATKQADARELVTIYLFDLDDAEEAAKWADRAKDEALARVVALANKPYTQLTESESFELAEAYESQLKRGGTTDYSRRVRLRGVVRCYEQYMALHPAKDAGFLRAKMASDSAREELRNIRRNATGSSR